MSPIHALSRRLFRVTAPSTLVLAAIPFALSPRAIASDGSWTGNGSDSAWGTTANWSGISIPVSGNTATFNNAGNGKTTVTMGAQSTSVLTFNNAATAAYTIGTSVGSGSLTFGTAATNLSVTGAVTTNQRINSNLVLGTGAAGTYTFKNSSATLGQSLTIAGNVAPGTGGTPGAVVLTLDADSSGVGIVSGMISNGGATALSISKPTNSGTWVLSNANTYSGTTTLANNGGVLRLTNTAALGSSALALQGGTLQLRSDTGGATFNAASVTVTNAPTIDAGSLGTGKGLTLNLGGTLSIGNQTLNITGSNGYKVGIGPVTQSASGTTFNATTGNMVIGNISGTNTNLTFQGAQPGNQITGVIATGTGTVTYGQGDVNVRNAGKWEVSGQSTYSGQTTLNPGVTINLAANGTRTSGTLTSGPFGTGTLALGGATIIPTGGDRVIENAVGMSQDYAGVIGGSNNLTFNGLFSLETPAAHDTTLNIANTALVTFAGGVNLRANPLYFDGTGNVLINSAVTSTIGGVPQGGGRIVMLGTGTTTLANTASYTGNTGAFRGTFKLDYTQVGSSLTNAPANYISSSSALTLGGGNFTVLGRANGADTSNGAWTGSLTSPTITFPDGVPAGLVVGQGVSGTGITGGGSTAYIVSINGNTVTLNANPTSTSGGDFATSATTVTTSQTMNGTTLLQQSASSVTVNANGGGGTVLNLGNIGRNDGSTVDFTLPAGAQTATNGIRTSANNGTGGILGGYATVGGTDWAVTGASGTNNVTALGSYETSYSLAGSASNFDATDSGTFTNTAINTLRFNTAGAATATLAGAFSIGRGGILVTSAVGSNPTTISGGTSLTTGLNDLVIIQNNAAGSLTIDSVVTGGKALTKAGPGTLILTGTNTYTGKTFITGGILKISSDSNLGTAPVAVADMLYLNGGTLQVGASFTLSANRRMYIGDSGGTIDTNGFDLTFGGKVTRSIQSVYTQSPLIKKGAGTLTLTDTTSNYTTLIVQEGTLSVASLSNAGGDGTLGNSGFSATLGGSGTTGTLQFTGATASSSKRFTLAAGGGAFEVTTGGTVLTLTGMIDGDGGLTKNGPGTLVIGSTGTASANTYNGDTTINAGILRTANDRALPNGPGRGNVSIGAAGTLDTNNVSSTVNGLSGSGTLTNATGTGVPVFTIGANDATSTFTGNITNSTGTLSIAKIGAGTLKLGGTNTYSGATSVSGGVLLVTGTHTGGNYIVGSGATLGGTGTITPSGTNTVAIDGTIAPGDSTLASSAQTGVLNIANTINLNSGSGVVIQLGGASPGNGAGNYDQLNMTSLSGAVNLSGTVSFSLSLVNGFNPLITDLFFVFTRADSGSFSSTFDGLPEGSTITLPGVGSAKISYLGNWTGNQGTSTLTGGNDIVIYNIVAIPEPHEFALAVMGLLVVLVMARRRRLHQS